MSVSTTPTTVQAAYRRIFVTGPWLPEGLVSGAYWNGKPWHHLTVPMFSRADAERLCEVIPELQFDVSRNAFKHEERGKVQWFDAEAQIVDGNQVDLYAVGFGWGWEFAKPLSTVPAVSGESMDIRIRPAALAWMQELADGDCTPVCAYTSFLISGYVEQRMEERHPFDLSGFDAALCIASKSPAPPGTTCIAVQTSDWLGIVDALSHLVVDGDFTGLTRQARRVRIVEAIVDQLARELGRV